MSMSRMSFVDVFELFRRHFFSILPLPWIDMYVLVVVLIISILVTKVWNERILLPKRNLQITVERMKNQYDVGSPKVGFRRENNVWRTVINSSITVSIKNCSIWHFTVFERQSYLFIALKKVCFEYTFCVFYSKVKIIHV